MKMREMNACLDAVEATLVGRRAPPIQHTRPCKDLRPCADCQYVLGSWSLGFNKVDNCLRGDARAATVACRREGPMNSDLN